MHVSSVRTSTAQTEGEGPPCDKPFRPGEQARGRQSEGPEVPGTPLDVSVLAL